MATREEMWSIYHSFYHYSKEDFMKRIPRNTHYALFRDNGKLVGFTGIKIDNFNYKDKDTLLIYFGQTIITRGARGKSLIPIAATKLIMLFWKKFLFSNVYFWADALTYKPYLVFAKTLDEMYPSYRYPMTNKIKGLIDFIGTKHYGETYDAATGTVRKEIYLVKDPAAIIRTGDIQDPDVQFFAQANPNHEQGQGLITLGPANRKNIYLIIERFFKSKFKRSKTSPQPQVGKVLKARVRN